MSEREEDALIDASGIPEFMIGMARPKLRQFLRQQNNTDLLASAWSWLASQGVVIVVVVVFLLIGGTMATVTGACKFAKDSPHSKLFFITASLTAAIIGGLCCAVWSFRTYMRPGFQSDAYWSGVKACFFGTMQETFVEDSRYKRFLQRAMDETAVDCEWEYPDEWSKCSSACNGGTQTRTIRILKRPSRNGAKCPTTPQIRPCNQNVKCPVDCDFSWTDWGPCSETCGIGTQRRSIIVRRAASNGGTRCPAMEHQQRRCPGLPECRTNCQYTWNDWGECSKECGGGVRVRLPIVVVKDANGGQRCPVSQQEACNAQPCPKDCVVAWGQWRDCDQTTATMKRSPTIIRQSEGDGASCPTEDQTMPCPVDCKYEWSPWTDCEGECGTGVRYREPVVTIQPQNSGKACPAVQAEKCKLSKSCCEYDETPPEVSRCTVICGGGQSKVVHTAVAYGEGVQCPDKDETISCNTQKCPPMPPGYEDGGLAFYYCAESMDSTGAFLRNVVADRPDNDAIIVTQEAGEKPVLTKVGTRSILSATSKTVVKFPQGLLRHGSYTLFHVCGYSRDAPKDKRKRIVTGDIAFEWFSGFFDGRAGIAVHGDWITPESQDVEHPEGLLVITTDTTSMLRSNGRKTSFDDAKGLQTPSSVSINTYPGEASDFDFACLLVYSNALTEDQVSLVEAWLATQYAGITAISHATVRRPTARLQLTQVLPPGGAIANGRFSARFSDTQRAIEVFETTTGLVTWRHANESKKGRLVVNSDGRLSVTSTNGITLWTTTTTGTGNILTLALTADGRLTWCGVQFSTTSTIRVTADDGDVVVLREPIVSVNQKYALALPSSGRLTLSDVSRSRAIPIWVADIDEPDQVPTFKYQARITSGGGLVVVNTTMKDRVVWSADTSGIAGAVRLTIEDDGTVSMLDDTSKKVTVIRPPTTSIPSDDFRSALPSTFNTQSFPPVMTSLTLFVTADSWDPQTSSWNNHVGVSAMGKAQTAGTLLPGASVPKVVSDPKLKRNVLIGDVDCVITFDGVKLTSGRYTVFYVAKQRGLRGLVFTCMSRDWASGFSASAAGMAYHGRWITERKDLHGYDWVVGTDQLNFFRSNGETRSFNQIAAAGFAEDTELIYPDNISINRARAADSPGTWTMSPDNGEFCVACLLVYARELSIEEIKIVEAFLYANYDVTASAISSPVLAVDPPTIPPTPWAYYVGESFTGKKWHDVSGNARDADILVQGATATDMDSVKRKMVVGASSVRVVVPMPSKTARDHNVTVFHVAKYNGADRGVIFSNSTDMNAIWVSGFSEGKSGVAKRGNTTSNPFQDVHGTSWVVTVDQSYMFRSNGTTRMDLDPSVVGMSVGVGPNMYLGGSDFAIACILVYDQILSFSEIVAVENFLKETYNLTFSADIEQSLSLYRSDSAFSPSSLPVQSGLVAHYVASSLSVNENVWRNVADKSRNRASDPYDISVVSPVVVKQVRGVECVAGTTTDEILFPKSMLADEYTLVHVSSYVAGSKNKNLIFATTQKVDENGNQIEPSWLSGFDKGKPGVAKHGSWLTPVNTASPHGQDDWIISVDQPKSYRSNGANRHIVVPKNAWVPENVAVNAGHADFASDFQIACVLVYSRELSVSEIRLVELFLARKYSLPVDVQQPLLVAPRTVTSPNQRYALQLVPGDVELVALDDSRNRMTMWKSGRFGTVGTGDQLVANVSMRYALSQNPVEMDPLSSLPDSIVESLSASNQDGYNGPHMAFDSDSGSAWKTEPYRYDVLTGIPVDGNNSLSGTVRGDFIEISLKPSTFVSVSSYIVTTTSEVVVMGFDADSGWSVIGTGVANSSSEVFVNGQAYYSKLRIVAVKAPTGGTGSASISHLRLKVNTSDAGPWIRDATSVRLCLSDADGTMYCDAVSHSDLATIDDVKSVILQRTSGWETWLNVHCIALYDEKNERITTGVTPDLSSPYDLTSTYLAINLMNDPADGKPPAITGTAKNAFFRLALSPPRRVSRVLIVNRKDCCQDRIVGTQLILTNSKNAAFFYAIDDILQEYVINARDVNPVVAAPWKLPSVPVQKCSAVVLRRSDGRKVPLNVHCIAVFDGSGARITTGVVPEAHPPYSDSRFSAANLMNNETDVTALCAATQEDENAYLRLTLSPSRTVSRVVIINRLDCCKERIVGTVLQLAADNTLYSYPIHQEKAMYNIDVRVLQTSLPLEVSVSDAGQVFLRNVVDKTPALYLQQIEYPPISFDSFRNAALVGNFSPETFDAGASKWYNSVHQGIPDASIHASNASPQVIRPTNAAPSFVRGSRDAKVFFPDALNYQWYTVIHVARYGGSTLENGRIFTHDSTKTSNEWVSGFTDDSYGVAKMGQTWITPKFGTYDTGEWVVTVHSRGYSSRFVKTGINTAQKVETALGKLRVNGVDVSTNTLNLNRKDEPYAFAINGDQACPADWEVALVLVYNNELQEDAIEVIENYLMSKYDAKKKPVYRQLLEMNQIVKNDKYALTLSEVGDLQVFDVKTNVVLTSLGTGNAGATSLWVRNSSRDMCVYLGTRWDMPHVMRWVAYPLINACTSNSVDIQFDNSNGSVKVVCVPNVSVDITKASTMMRRRNVDNVFQVKDVLLRRTDSKSLRVSAFKIMCFDITGSLIPIDDMLQPIAQPVDDKSPSADSVVDYLSQTTGDIVFTGASPNAFIKVSLASVSSVTSVMVIMGSQNHDMTGANLQLFDGDGVMIYDYPITTREAFYSFVPEPRIMAEKVRIRRIDEAVTALNVSEVQVYDSEGFRIPGKKMTASAFPPVTDSRYGADNLVNDSPDVAMTSANPYATMEVSIVNGTDVSAVVVVNRRDCCRENLVGTRIELLDRDGDVIVSQDVTQEMPEYMLTVRKYVPIKKYVSSDFVGDIRGESVMINQPMKGSVQQCAAACDANAMCAGFAREKKYDPNDLADCYLQTSFENVVQNERAWETWTRITAAKTYGSSAPVYTAENFHQPGFDIRPLTGTLRNCINACESDPECTGFARSKADTTSTVGSCWLKKAGYSSNVTWDDPTYQTWTKPGTRLPYKWYGFHPLDSDISQLTGSMQQCIDACDADPTCAGFTRPRTLFTNPTVRTCVLKKGFSNVSWEDVGYETWSKPNMSVPYRAEDFHQNGCDIRKVNASLQHCVDACDADPACVAFTRSKTTSDSAVDTCWLKSRGDCARIYHDPNLQTWTKGGIT